MRSSDAGLPVPAIRRIQCDPFRLPERRLHWRYAQQLTLSDVRQVVELARHDPRIVKPVYQIVMDRPDEAEVNSGPDVQGALGTTFKVRKQNGRWILLEESINTGQTFFTA